METSKIEINVFIHSTMNNKIGREIKQDVVELNQNLKDMVDSLKKELKEIRMELDNRSKLEKYDEDDNSHNKILTDKTKQEKNNTLNDIIKDIGLFESEEGEIPSYDEITTKGRPNNMEDDEYITIETDITMSPYELD